MRLVTWNCYSGSPEARLADLAPLKPDVVVLQECSRPAPDRLGKTLLWFGENPRKGVAVSASNGYYLEAGPLMANMTHTIFPVVVGGPVSFHLAAIWAARRPSYVRAVLNGLTAYADFLKGVPSVVAGDFNSHSRWDNAGGAATHSRLVEILANEFKLVSAYHRFHGGSVEDPTLFWQWKESHPYHIDYCFIPCSWVSMLSNVSVGTYKEWADKSDHRPIVVDLSLETATWI